jgi:hypothetical protein
LGALTTAGACAEQLESGAACPALCPTENAPVRDTVLDAVAFDTTLVGYPGSGGSGVLLLALRRGADSLDVRTVVRFDALPARYFPPAGGDSLPITRVDSAFVRLRFDTSGTRFTRPVTIEAYDVDTTAAADTVSGALAALFRPDRRLAAVTVQPGALRDSLRIPLPGTLIAARAGGSRRLRVGFRVRSDSAVSLRVLSAQGGLGDFGPRLSFDPATDTLYRPVLVLPQSNTPAVTEVAAGLQDFQIVAHTARSDDAGALVVGGLPARRTYIRFVVPARLADSTTIVRAVLELVQRPARGVDARDSVVVRPVPVVATARVTDVRRAADLIAPGILPLDSLRLAPGDSGRRALSLVTLVRAWRGFPVASPRAIVLRAGLEGLQGGELRFFSVEAPVGLRPRLRLSYIPASNFGLP